MASVFYSPENKNAKRRKIEKAIAEQKNTIQQTYSDKQTENKAALQKKISAKKTL